MAAHAAALTGALSRLSLSNVPPITQRSGSPKRADVVKCSASSKPLQGQTFLVTGSTDGIGQHTATRLAEQGATVLVHGRKAACVEKTIDMIGKRTGNKDLVPLVYDLASFSEVRALAAAVQKQAPELDVLINNAGVYEEQLSYSEEGFELTWAVNVLAPYLLTGLLLPCVQRRIVNVASISASSRIDFGNLNQEKGFSSHNAYSLSKLASILFTLPLARRLEAAGSSVTANCLDPGTVNTKMLLAGWGRIGIDVPSANNEFMLATSPEWDATTGRYFIGGRPARPPSVAEDVDTQQRLWAVLEEHTGFTYADTV